MFVCPKCKTPLEEYRCHVCLKEYATYSGIPDFLTADGNDERLRLASVYNEIYSAHSDAFEDQGRRSDFRAYFAALVAEIAPGSLLEVGCGEGALLADMHHAPKCGIDPSIQALMRAQRRSESALAVATAENLPFPDHSFNAVTAVGVMEFFADTDAALAEIFRVLVEGGAYVALVHLDMSFGERIRQKLREYLIPRPRPIRFARWLAKTVYKLRKPIRQPQRRISTIEAASDCFRRIGFSVERVVTQQNAPEAHLAGEHVVIFVARRPSDGQDGKRRPTATGKYAGSGLCDSSMQA
jgi:ubiquinone/menaquinone biosynthesis C-methylase UbiE